MSASAWKRGESGNPGDRPKVSAEIGELARDYGAQAIERQQFPDDFIVHPGRPHAIVIVDVHLAFDRRPATLFTNSKLAITFPIVAIRKAMARAPLSLTSIHRLGIQNICANSLV